MHAHQLDAQGVIINTIVVNSLDDLPDLADAAIGGVIGDSIVNGQVIAQSVQPALAHSIPMLNLKLILAKDGKTSTVEAVFASMEGVPRDEALAYWTTAQNAERTNYLVNQLWPELYADEAAFNDAWARAAALTP